MFEQISRRRVLQAAAATALAGTMPVQRAFAKDTVVGFIYVGPRDDYGYNQSHAQGAAALKKMPGVRCRGREACPRRSRSRRPWRVMINLDGATLLFPTSFGYFSPHMVKMAAKYPKMSLRACGGLWTDKDPKNTGSYFGYIDEAQYIAASSPAT